MGLNASCVHDEVSRERGGSQPVAPWRKLWPAHEVLLGGPVRGPFGLPLDQVVEAGTGASILPYRFRDDLLLDA